MEKNSKICDLHIHSNYSDSDAAVEEIFKEASSKKICCLSVTDHDNIDGLDEAKHFSQYYGVELVEGIELSTYYDNSEVHILGYFINTQSLSLKNELSAIRELRRERIIAMADKLNSLGVKVDKEKLFLKIRHAIPTRLHLALYLCQMGAVSSLWEAFKRYLSPGKPAYVGRFKYSVKEGIQLIKNNMGLAFLAHPYILPDISWVDEFASFGLDGLEIFYPRISEEKISLYSKIADRLSLLKSGGSDAHGSFKKFTEIGRATIGYEWVAKMKERRAILVSHAAGK